MPELLVNIDIDDLPKAIDFYTRAFGLTVGRRFGEGGVELLGLATPLYLLVKAAGTRASPTASAQRDYGRHWTPVHLDLAVDDLEASLAAAEAAGARLEAPLRNAPWGRMAVMADPFGHGFCLLEFRGRGYDEVATGSGS